LKPSTDGKSTGRRRRSFPARRLSSMSLHSRLTSRDSARRPEEKVDTGKLTHLRCKNQAQSVLLFYFIFLNTYRFNTRLNALLISQLNCVSSMTNLLVSILTAPSFCGDKRLGAVLQYYFYERLRKNPIKKSL